MSISPHVPSMAIWPIGKEIIGIAEEKRRPILWQLRVEDVLRRQRHAGDDLEAEVTKTCNSPSI